MVITKNGRPRTVLMAYEDFVRLSKRDRRVQRTIDLSEAEIAAVEAAEMTPDPGHLGSRTRRQTCCRLRSSSAGCFRYSYLWDCGSTAKAARRATRTAPAWVLAIVMTTEDGAPVVRVLPITHTPPANPADAIEIPAAVKNRLRLDHERSWIVLTESNRFTWPGPDLRNIETDSGYYGALTPGLFARGEAAVRGDRPRRDPNYPAAPERAAQRVTAAGGRGRPERGGAGNDRVLWSAEARRA